jgi:hypothetical protein
MYRVRSRGRPRPQGQACFPSCTRGGFLRASCPAAHVQLAYLDALTCSHHRLSSVYSRRCTNQSSHHGGRQKPDKRMQPCPEGLPGSPKWAGVHHIRMDVRYVCRIWSEPCWFCVHRVLRYRPHARPPRLHIDNWLMLGPYKPGDIVVPRVFLPLSPFLLPSPLLFVRRHMQQV